uniref:Endo/exonuclease/phosphatase domain-containing protein n=1 Tax=Macrostomum lignano TaxID=282301 RepID=A0A1I8JFI5_9PLAT
MAASSSQSPAESPMMPSLRRRAEVRVGQLPAFGNFQDFPDDDSSSAEMPASCRRYQHRRAAAEANQQQSRRPRAVPTRRLTVRRRCSEWTSMTFSATVQLDLTGVSDIRAEVAYHGQASGCPKSDSSKNQSDDVEDRERKPTSGLTSATTSTSSWGGRSRFVQVRNPLCVPRCSDNLGTWRTCMVPIADLERFAFMKPPRQRWRNLAQPSHTDETVFTLMSYNILSNQYASAKTYWYCPDWALAWSYRRQGLMEVICCHLPSVLCLQEVETEQFFSFFLPTLEAKGYDGIFSPKSRARTMEARLRPRVDGCAIFWKSNEFSLVEKQVIELNQQYLEQCWTSPKTSADTAASSEIFSRVSPRDNIALAAVLMPTVGASKSSDNSTSSRPVLVCNSHVHWDPQHPDVKLIQTMLLAGALAAIIGRYKNCLPLLLCGDFNSLPQSGVIEFITLGSVPRSHPDFRRLGEDPSLDGLQDAAVAAATAATPAAPGSTEATNSEASSVAAPDGKDKRFFHQLGLQSCYSGVDTAFTNYTHDFKGVIDYIFAARQHFRVLDCLDGLADWFRSEAVLGCPNAYVPSDHIPLMVRLQLTRQRALTTTATTKDSAASKSFFLPTLEAKGYDGIFSPKSRARTMEARLRPRVDGCAIFRKSN